MLESWTCDMEVEQHASAVSSEIGFQSAGAVNRPDTLSYGRIVKRAHRNGFLDVDRCRKARKLSNHVKNVGININPKSTLSKSLNKNERNGNREIPCFNGDEKDAVTSNGKGLPTNELVGKGLKNAIEFKGCDALAFQEDDEVYNGVSDYSKNEEDDFRIGLGRKENSPNHEVCGIQQNSHLIISKKQKGRLSFNGHCAVGNHGIKNRKEIFKCRSTYLEEDSSNSSINNSLGDIDDLEIRQNLEKCGSIANGMDFASSYCDFNEEKRVGNDCNAKINTKMDIEENYSRKNGFLENKCTKLGKESHNQSFKKVRLKKISVKHDTNTVRQNSNFSTFSSNYESDAKIRELNSCDVSKLAERSDNAFFKTVNRSNNNTYHTKQKSRNYNTTIKHIENNIVKDEKKKINSHIGEETAPKVKAETSSCSLDLRIAPERVPANSIQSSKEDSKETNNENDGTSKSSSVVCNWVNCDAKLSDAMELKTHVKEVHVKTMAASDLFFCFWKGCKVYNKPSSSYNWLVKHVNTHVGIRPFQCVIEPCSLSFASHGALIRHVQSHFNERSKYYKKPKNPIKEVAASPGRTEDTLSGSESTSSKESKRRKSKMFMRRTRHFNSNSMNDDLDRNSMIYIKKKLFHLENNSGKSIRINGLRSVFQPFGRRTLENDRSQFLMAFKSSERHHKWYNEQDVLFGGLCQLPITQLPIEQRDKLYVDIFGHPKQRRGRKYKKEDVT